jgi:hypothetical protein
MRWKITRFGVRALTNYLSWLTQGLRKRRTQTSYETLRCLKVVQARQILLRLRRWGRLRGRRLPCRRLRCGWARRLLLPHCRLLRRFGVVDDNLLRRSRWNRRLRRLQIRSQPRDLSFLGRRQTLNPLRQLLARALKRAQIVCDRLKIVFRPKSPRYFDHITQHVIQGIEIAVEFESCGQILGLRAQLRDDLRESALQVALNRIHVRQRLFLRAAVRLPAVNSQIRQVGLRALCARLELRQHSVQLSYRRIRNRLPLYGRGSSLRRILPIRGRRSRHRTRLGHGGRGAQ